MAIPVPTVPSTQTPISSVDLKPTINNKAFYINSGIMQVNNTETTVISVNDIGKRDIILCVNAFIATASDDQMTLKVKNNGEDIYKNVFIDRYDTGPFNNIHYIIPANTSIEITMQNSDSTVHDAGVSCYGYYLEAM